MALIYVVLQGQKIDVEDLKFIAWLLTISLYKKKTIKKKKKKKKTMMMHNSK